MSAEPKLSQYNDLTFKLEKCSCYNCDFCWFGKALWDHECQHHKFKFVDVMNLRMTCDLKDYVCREWMRTPFLPGQSDEN